MSKIRISTTVEPELMQRARACCGGAKDATVIEQALIALIADHRAAEIDHQLDLGYAQIEYERPDAWGDLPGFLDALNGVTRAPDAR